MPNGVAERKFRTLYAYKRIRGKLCPDVVEGRGVEKANICAAWAETVCHKSDVPRFSLVVRGGKDAHIVTSFEPHSDCYPMHHYLLFRLYPFFFFFFNLIPHLPFPIPSPFPSSITSGVQFPPPPPPPSLSPTPFSSPQGNR